MECEHSEGTSKQKEREREREKGNRDNAAHRTWMTSIWTLGQGKEQRNKKKEEEEDEDAEEEKTRNNTDVSSIVLLDYTTN